MMQNNLFNLLDSFIFIDLKWESYYLFNPQIK